MNNGGEFFGDLESWEAVHEFSGDQAVAFGIIFKEVMSTFSEAWETEFIDTEGTGINGAQAVGELD